MRRASDTMKIVGDKGHTAPSSVEYRDEGQKGGLLPQIYVLKLAIAASRSLSGYSARFKEHKRIGCDAS